MSFRRLIRHPVRAVWLLIVLGLIAGLVVAVVAVQPRVREGEATQSHASGTFSFTEEFDTTTYRDGSATTADWNTTRGEVGVQRASGEWSRASNTTSGFDNVSNQPTLSSFTGLGSNLVMSADNRPYVTWEEHKSGEGNEVYFAYWDGSAWKGLTGGSRDNISNRTAADNAPCIGMGSDERPVIAWTASGVGGGLLASRWTGLSWSGPETVSTTFPSFYCELAIDSSNKPAVGWHSFSSGETHYAEFASGSWSAEETISSGAGCDAHSPSIAFDANDVAHISYADDSACFPSTLEYATRTSPGVWSNETVVAPSSMGGSAQPQLAFDSLDRPGITWVDNSTGNNEVYFTRKVGATWSKADGTAGFDTVSGTSTGSGSSSFAFDRYDRPVVSWGENLAGPNEVIAASRWNGSAWTQMDETTPGFNNLVADLGLATGEVSRFSSLFTDSCGEPGIVWEEELQPVANPGVLDAIFTRWFREPQFPGVAQSTVVDATGENLTSARLDSVYRDDGSSITYYLSNDGGATFAEVTPGVQHVFDTIGSDLVWRAVLEDGAANVSCPTIESLSISYSTDPIVRISGTNPIEQAIAISRVRFPTFDSASVGVLTRDDVLVDALTIAPLISRTGATHLLNASELLHTDVLTEFERALPAGATIYIGGGTAAISEGVQSGLEAAGFTTIRLGGENRLETATSIANKIIELQPPGSTTKAYLAEHAVFADALALGAIAGDLDDDLVDPIILNRRGDPAVDEHTGAFLAAHPEIVQLELVGGPAALADGLETTLQSQYANLQSVPRTFGENRFATNVALAEAHLGVPTMVVVANGQEVGLPGSSEVVSGAALQAAQVAGTGFFDALLAGPYAAAQGAPLLLTRAPDLPIEIRDYLSQHAGSIVSVTLIGSELYISADVEAEIAALLF